MAKYGSFIQSKNPAKFWVMDTDKSPWTVKATLSKESTAEHVAEQLNRKEGRGRYQVLGFGVGNPSLDPFAVYVQEPDKSYTLLDQCMAFNAKDAINEISKRYGLRQNEYKLKAVRHKAKSTYTAYPKKIS